jgi:putative ABC transport system substrate-binding protein
MRRRDFIAMLGGAAGAWPLAARAQQTAPARRFGVLLNNADDPATQALLATFEQELERLGWSQKQNVHIEYRFVAARSDQYLPLAQQLIALHPDVIVAQGTKAAGVLQQQTHSIPIVFNYVSDPIGSGFVASLARPGGNMTGILLYETGITSKWLAMLKEIASSLSRVAILGNPKTTPFEYFLRSAAAAAPSLAIEIVPAPVGNVDAEIQRAIESFAAQPNGGLLILPDSTTTDHRKLIIELAAQHRLPAVYPYRLFVAMDGLMSYGTDQNDVFRLSADYVDRILRGTKPADLPVQEPTKYETVVNLKSAKAIGIVVPPSLLVQADEVIE